MDDKARSLRDPEVRAQRKLMLREEHMAPLAEFAEVLRRRHSSFIPEFDGLDGGIGAKILFLLEKPGPKTCPDEGGSGFISRNNDDATAEAIFNFMNCASIPRKDAIIWNVIPWWDGQIKFNTAEVNFALNELEHLRKHLPHIHTIMLVGATAESAYHRLRELNADGRRIRVLASAHPGPKVRATRPALWNSIPGLWRAAHDVSWRGLLD